MLFTGRRPRRQRESSTTTVVWAPKLIRAEIDRRIHEVRESNPSKQKKDSLVKERERVRKGTERLLDAYQEGFLSLEELRRRMPDLRKRETALDSQIHALEATAVDQRTYLQLAGNVQDFLGRMSKSAATLNVTERQRILRLLVKEIHVGPDTLTIKHSIPTSTPTGSSNIPSYQLRTWPRRALPAHPEGENCLLPLCLLTFTRFGMCILSP